MKADRNRDTGWLATNGQAESKVSVTAKMSSSSIPTCRISYNPISDS